MENTLNYFLYKMEERSLWPYERPTHTYSPSRPVFTVKYSLNSFTKIIWIRHMINEYRLSSWYLTNFFHDSQEIERVRLSENWADCTSLIKFFFLWKPAGLFPRSSDASPEHRRLTIACLPFASHPLRLFIASLHCYEFGERIKGTSILLQSNRLIFKKYWTFQLHCSLCMVISRAKCRALFKTLQWNATELQDLVSCM